MNRVRSKLRLNYMRAWMRKKMDWIPRPVRRAIVGVIGGTLMLLALIGFILPVMPGFIFVPFGLAILAVEFAWAARWLKRIKKKAKSMRDRVSPGRHAQSHGTAPAAAPPVPPHQPQRNAAA